MRWMRWVALVGALLMTACGSTPEPARAPAAAAAAPVVSRAGPSLGALLAELEENLRPEAVSPAWTERRARWRSEAQAAETGRAVAGLLAELERFVRWSVAVQGWRERRPDWIEEVEAVANDWGAAICLGELEANVARSAVSARWRVRRPRWIDDLRRAVGLRPARLLERRRRVEQRGALWVLKNRTKATLSLRWSGPMEGSRKLAPGKEASVALIPGSYVIQARSGDGARKVLVREFEEGFRYTERFDVDER